ncbi:MAG: hypothetical protein A2277_15400 [Desulfobacterales bacterium RIFOXYA12_FULL_46_15]|nr:MAG: hypothetical protein A2277_15400 [Desulfobacterales bacterium RIFOXYA12_FULL_46_15]
MQANNIPSNPISVQANPQVRELNKPIPPVPPPEKSQIAKSDEDKGVSSGKKENKASSDMEDMKDMVEFINDQINNLQTNIGFSINEKYDNQIIVEIKDKKTDEVIKQIPSEEFLKIKEKMEDLIGIIFSGTA